MFSDLNDFRTLLEGTIIPLYKPIGITSFDVVSKVRRASGIKKVGHAGTLDPFAEGVLIVGIGRSATRRLDEFQAMEKEYIGRVVLGITTDTFDSAGRVVDKRDFRMPSESQILQVLSHFEGDILQLPPMYSALKVKGVRMYKAARKGINLERLPRKVNIKSIDLLEITPDGFEMKVVCSKGTYIRTLAYDIGTELGMGAHLGNLKRTRIGSYGLEHTKSLESFVSWISNGQRSS